MSLHQYARALKITFTNPLVAGQVATFSWTQEQSDPLQIWLRKAKVYGDFPLDGSVPSADWQDQFIPLDLRPGSGNSSIFFPKAGLFDIGIFDTPKYPSASVQPIEVVQAAVFSANNTSYPSVPASTRFYPSSPPAITRSHSLNTSGSMPSQQPPDQPTLTPNQQKLSPGSIAGVTVGAGASLVVSILLLWICHRRARNVSPSLESGEPENLDAIKDPNTNNNPSHRNTLDNPEHVVDTTAAQHDATRDSRPLPPVPEVGDFHLPETELPPAYSDSSRRANATENGEEIGERRTSDIDRIVKE
ncbi:hypothetical protein L218DRAFT_1005647 [Marasmius fiardii PR-910]|nr:hypothetical protein L218DRAFT_1005647 [Marasmius fiardii PR-910]